MWMTLILTLSVLNLGRAWECGGDLSEPQIGPPHLRSLTTRSTTTAPIRFFYHYHEFDLQTPEANAYFQTTLMDYVDNYFSHALKVKSILTPIVLSGISDCGGVPIPSDHVTTGVSGADVIVYITTDTLSVGYVAKAGFCVLDSGAQNPLAGIVIVNVQNFNDLSNTSKYFVMIHEMTHLLGFSSGAFKYWKDSNGNPYASGTMTEVISIRGATKTILKTPNVVAAAQSVFGCNSLQGMELEDAGSSGTAGSHWDKRIMLNEYMAGSVPSNAVVSTITLGLFEDSGWYEVDYSVTDPNVIGKSSGCDYFDRKCIESGVSVFPDIWCTDSSAFRCDAFMLKKGKCNYATYSGNLPSYYQYFASGVNGGSDSLADYCPYRSGYSNGDCRGAPGSTFTFEESHEVLGLNSRCFISNLISGGYSVTPPYSACYEVIACSNTDATVRIGTNIVSCPFTGATITLPGYTGSLTCPSSDILCRSVPCLSGCFGSGKCVNSLCECYKGYYGDDCSGICPSNCDVCSSDTECITCSEGFNSISGVCSNECPLNCASCTLSICNTCVNGYEKVDGVCIIICESGFYIDSTTNTCSPCSVNCNECSSGSVCVGCESGYSVVSGSCSPICASNCVSCGFPSKCDVCADGYYKNEQNTCTQCTSPCSLCDGTSCSACISGYSVFNHVCIPDCAPNCLSCTLLNKCDVCADGYYKNDQSTCTQCPLTCKKCTGFESCTECISGYNVVNNICVNTCNPGYYKSGNSCLPCTAPCTGCTSDSFCTSCASGYSLVNNACALTCASNCNICTSSYTCDDCLDGFYRNFESTCSSCPTVCTMCSSNEECSGCLPGYSLISNTCVEDCEPGFYLTLDNNCAECSSNCNDCVSQDICNTCDSPYQLVGGYCIQCPVNCKTCTSSTVCSVCNDSYFNYRGVCKLCPVNCTTCSSGTVCTSCAKGTYLNSNNRCAKCMVGCLDCRGSSDCSQCAEGYEYVLGKCKLICPDNCKLCTSNTVCKVCSSGYYLEPGIPTSCNPCVLPCLTCNSAEECTKCSPGTFLADGECITCDDGCAVCTDLMNCRRCKTGYVNNNGICEVKCPRRCLSCTTSESCDECESGFFALGTGCTRCAIGCNECTSLESCSDCKPMFYSDSGVCKRCGGNCLRCVDKTHCSECVEGFYTQTIATGVVCRRGS